MNNKQETENKPRRWWEGDYSVVWLPPTEIADPLVEEINLEMRDRLYPQYKPINNEQK